MGSGGKPPRAWARSNVGFYISIRASNARSYLKGPTFPAAIFCEGPVREIRFHPRAFIREHGACAAFGSGRLEGGGSGEGLLGCGSSSDRANCFCAASLPLCAAEPELVEVERDPEATLN